MATEEKDARGTAFLAGFVVGWLLTAVLDYVIYVVLV